MSLKDWKMTRDFGRIFQREYINKKELKIGIEHELIVQNPDGTENWFTYANRNGENIFDKKYKSKKQAIKSARIYMKKH